MAYVDDLWDRIENDFDWEPTTDELLDEYMMDYEALEEDEIEAERAFRDAQRHSQGEGMR